jgi:hypothetical protein
MLTMHISGISLCSPFCCCFCCCCCHPVFPGALKLANHHHLPSLAERISAFLEERMDWEEQQQQQVRGSSKV